MRARNIKPGFFINEILGQSDPYLQILFAGLWCLADKDGRLEDRPMRIKVEVFPYRGSLDVHGYLTELSRLGFIIRYQVGELKLIQVVNFSKHQSPHHTEKESILPSIEYSDGCHVTVSSPLRNGENPPDSLIPDSLIPDSLIPDSLIPDSVPKTHKGGSGNKKPGKTPSWKTAFPDDVTDTVFAIMNIWADPKRDIQPKRCPADPTNSVPESHPRSLADRITAIQREGGDLNVCVEIAKEYIKDYRSGKLWVKAAENFFGKADDAPFKIYYPAYMTNLKLQEKELESESQSR